MIPTLRIRALPLCVGLALLVVPAGASAQKIITNGTIAAGGVHVPGPVQLGVNTEGHLIVGGGTPSSGTGTTRVGVRLMENNAEGTAAGCECEGWGVGDALSGIAGYANRGADGGVHNLRVVGSGGLHTQHWSRVDVLNPANGTPVMNVLHHYRPLAPYLFEVDVWITNLTANSMRLRYRRVIDWDVEPTAFDELVTIRKGVSPYLVTTTNNGRDSANPLRAPVSLGDRPVSGSFVDWPLGAPLDPGRPGFDTAHEPLDQGALFDFDFGILAPGRLRVFRMYIGVAPSLDAAEREVSRVGAEAVAYGKAVLRDPADPGTPRRQFDANGNGIGDSAESGFPNTFILAFRYPDFGDQAAGISLPAEGPRDFDGDGLRDSMDNCRIAANANQVDTDADGRGDACDNCLLIPNTNQLDTDGDALGNVCDPAPDTADHCPAASNVTLADTDGDAVPDVCDPDDDNDTVADAADNCPLDANVSQANVDNDALGDACDPDDDNDGIVNGADNCRLAPNPDQHDADGDGRGNACDDDADNDGLPVADNCPLAANPDQFDTDGDAQGNACDPDDDNDGTADAGDNCPLTINADQADADRDGIGDACDGGPAADRFVCAPIDVTFDRVITLPASLGSRQVTGTMTRFCTALDGNSEPLPGRAHQACYQLAAPEGQPGTTIGMLDEMGPATFGLTATDGLCLPAEITDLVPPGGDPRQPVLFGTMVGEGKFLSGGLLFKVQVNVRHQADGAVRYSALRVDACSVRMDETGPVCKLLLNRLNATNFSSIRFHDDPAFTPDGLPADPAMPTPDTLAASGEGTWSDVAGYAFTFTATDRGEPGAGLDTFAVTVRAPDGTVVAAGAGTLIDLNLEANPVR